MWAVDLKSVRVVKDCIHGVTNVDTIDHWNQKNETSVVGYARLERKYVKTIMIKE